MDSRTALRFRVCSAWFLCSSPSLMLKWSGPPYACANSLVFSCIWPSGFPNVLLGHSTSELTREVYLHAIPEDQPRAVASVEALLFGPNRTQIGSASQTSGLYQLIVY